MQGVHGAMQSKAFTARSRATLRLNGVARSQAWSNPSVVLGDARSPRRRLSRVGVSRSRSACQLRKSNGVLALPRRLLVRPPSAAARRIHAESYGCCAPHGNPSGERPVRRCTRWTAPAQLACKERSRAATPQSAPPRAEQRSAWPAGAALPAGETRTPEGSATSHHG